MRSLAWAILAAAAAGASAADDAAEGRRIAERWCAECHVVGAGQAAASDVAPSFAAIATERGRSDAWLRGWLADPHPPMPNPGLSRAQIDAVVAYLAGLRDG